MVNQMRKTFFIIGVLFAVSAGNVMASTNYDTSWSFVYDGGKKKDSSIIGDYFYDVKSLPDGGCICIGESGDTTSLMGQIVLMKLGSDGKIVWKKLYKRESYQYARALCVARNGDLIIGGVYQSAPLIMRTDSVGNVRWTAWYYDSTSRSLLFLHRAVVNCVRETRRGTIVCAAGDDYPDNNGQPLKNYAAFMELDSAGNIIRTREWNNVSGYSIAGFDIEETEGGEYLLSGNQAVFYLDTVARPVWQKTYSYQLEGVGSEAATICRAKVLRGNIPMVAGRVYEGNCWTKYNQLYYDAWWSPISYSDGSFKAWDTAGKQRGDDAIYDFTQLIDGKLVFVGDNANSQIGGVWAIVTDSTGKDLLWEKQFKLPYRTEDGRAPRAYSVCATMDSGFTVAGKYTCMDENGGTNAFAAHFVPTAGASISRTSCSVPKLTANTCRIIGMKVVFSFTNYNHHPERVSIYTVDGKQVMDSPILGMRKSADTFEWDFSSVGKGVYLYVIKAGQSLYSGNLVIGK